MQECLHAQSPGSAYTQKVTVLIRKMIIHKSKQRNKRKKLSTDSGYAAMTITRYGPFTVFKRVFKEVA